MLFCTLLSGAGGSFAPFRVLWERRKRIHIFPCIKGNPFCFGGLHSATDHPDSPLSFHAEAGSSAHMLHAQLAALVPTAPSWFVLRGPADGGLVLLAALGAAVHAPPPPPPPPHLSGV